jgi:hypothetical protein
MLSTRQLRREVIIWEEPTKEAETMSYEIHLNIPEDSQRGHLIASITAEHHLTPSQAVETIIDLAAQKQVSPARKDGKNRIPGLPSEPMSAEEAAVVDEAMAIVMAARRERSEHIFGS